MHAHKWVIYTSTKTPTRVGLLSRCECGREKFRGKIDGRRREQVFEDGRWADYDTGWVKRMEEWDGSR